MILWTLPKQAIPSLAATTAVIASDCCQALTNDDVQLNVKIENILNTDLRTDIVDVGRRLAARHKRIADRHVVAIPDTRFFKKMRSKFDDADAEGVRRHGGTDARTACDGDRFAQRRRACSRQMSAKHTGISA